MSEVLVNPYRFGVACAETDYQNEPVTGGSGGRKPKRAGDNPFEF